jgi:pimeloyl-ACP methyl ester carboxylesterase
MPFTKINDINMYYEITGEGYPMVLIHGLSASNEGWISQVPAFSQKYTVVTMDLRGHGQSDKPEMAYSIELFSNDIVALMDHLEIKQAIIIGVSMGGMVAQRMALDHSKYVNKLILVDTMSHMDKCLRMKMENGALLAERFGMEVQARNGLLWAFSPSFINEHSDEIMNIIDDVSSLPAGPYIQSVKACTGHDVKNQLSKIPVQTLVIVGEEDILTPRYFSKVLCENIPDCRMSVVKGSGHVTPIEQADDFNKIVLDFLE